MNETLRQRYNQLNELLENHIKENICVAFSGGVDSSLLLKAACDIGKRHNIPVLAVTFSTALHPTGDLLECKTMAQSFGAVFKEIKIDEFSNPMITNNPVDRCYHCKKYLFENLIDTASSLGYHYIIDGSNYDDLNAYRPGMKAIKELSIHSPLLELKITKKEIRSIAAFLLIPSSNKPSAPCLATRLPYNTPFDYQLLRNIEAGEEYIKTFGFYNVRLRLHGDIVRIETDQKDFPLFLAHRNEIIEKLKNLGFLYVTLDMEGFRSGSMDIKLPSPV